MKKRVLSLALVFAVAASLFVFAPSASAAISKESISLPSNKQAVNSGVDLDGNFILSNMTKQIEGAINQLVDGKFYSFIATDKSYAEILALTAADRGKAPYKFTWSAISEANKRPDGNLDISKAIKKEGLLFVAGGNDDVTAASLPKSFTSTDTTSELDKFEGVMLAVFSIREEKSGEESPEFDKVLKFDYSAAGSATLKTAKTTKDELEPVDTNKYEFAYDGSSEYGELPSGGTFDIQPYPQKITLRLKGSPGVTKKLTITAVGATPTVKPNLKNGTIPFKKNQELFIGSSTPVDGSSEIYRMPADGKGALSLIVNDPQANKDVLVRGSATVATPEEPVPLEITGDDSTVWIRNAATATKPASAWVKIELSVWKTTGKLDEDNFAMQNSNKLVAAGGSAIEMWNVATEKWVTWNYTAALVIPTETTGVTSFRLKGTATTWPGDVISRSDLSGLVDIAFAE